MSETNQSVVFLLGMPRSGTTLLSYVLNTHPDIAAPPEPWILLALESLGEPSPRNPADSVYISQGTREFVRGLDFLSLKRNFAQGLYRDFLSRAGKRIFVDKTPRYWQILDGVAELFPESRFIWLLRNPFDVAASMKATWGFDPTKAAIGDCDDLLQFDLVLGSRVLADFAERHKDQVFRLRYEDLVAEPAALANRVFAHLHAAPWEFDGSVRAVEAGYGRSSLGDKAILATDRVSGGQVNTWRSALSLEEAQALHDALGRDLLASLGYGACFDDLEAMGVVDRGAAITEAIVAATRSAYLRRRVDIERFSKPECWDATTYAVVQAAYRTPHTVLEGLQMRERAIAIEGQLAEARATNEGIQARLGEVLKELGETRTMKEAIQHQLEEARKDLGQLRARDDSYREQLADSHKANEALRGSLQDAVARLHVTQERVQELLLSRWRKLGQAMGIAKRLPWEDDKAMIGIPFYAGLLAPPSGAVAQSEGATVQEAAIGQADVAPPEVVAHRAASTDRALARIAARSVSIQTVIDVGASNGMWSAVALKHFPDARYLLVEAQKVHEPALKKYCGAHPATSYVLAAAGDSIGQIYFDDSDPFGGLASKEPTEKAKAILPVTTIDHEVAERNLPGPYLVKLDTHGFELPILRGARTTLAAANLVVIEVYNFQLTADSLLFWQMCEHMKSLGFGVIDISEPLWRQHDSAFWQMDLFFIPLSRQEFRHTSYR